VKPGPLHGRLEAAFADVEVGHACGPALLGELLAAPAIQAAAAVRRGDLPLVDRRARPAAVTGASMTATLNPQPVTKRCARPTIAGDFLWVPPP
jgi:hypothetical protein